MSLPREIRRAIERGDLESVESAWLELLADEPVDLPVLVSTARALAANDAGESSRFLLEMADEELRRRQASEQRWRLLRQTGELLVDAAEMHEAVEERIAALYPHHSAFDELVEYVGVHRAPEDLDRLWEKADHLIGLLEFDVGSVVLLSDRGAGRVTAVNAQLQSFRIELDDGSGLTVGFRGAARVLQALPQGHILRQRVERPEELRTLAEEDPAELLRRTLASFDGAVPASEVRNALEGIVEESSWSRWWSGARQHPQVLKEGGSRATYRWLESAEDAEDALWERFSTAPPLRRLGLLRQSADRSAALRRKMLEAIAEHAAEVAQAEPGLAFELAFEIRHESLPAAPEPDRLLAETPEPDALLAGITDRGRREEAYRRIQRLRTDSSQLLGRRLNQETDPRSVAVLAELLEDSDPATLTSFIDEVLAQPRRHPAAFLWLVERAKHDETLAARSPVRLLRNLVDAVSRPEFKEFRKVLEGHLDSGGTAARLIPLIDRKKASQVLEQLRRAAIEEYQREPLITALQLRFPELGGRGEQPIYALPESIEAKRKQLQRLHEEEIPANRQAIQEARELGDLRENFEYKAARQRHEYLSARLASLEAELARARTIDPRSEENPDTVRIGTTVELTAEDGRRRTVTLLGPWESDPEAGIVSHESEAGERLLGTAVNERVELPDGAFRVTAIRPWRPDS